MYLITVLRNLLIILAVISDPHLYTPMYFFLSILSLADIVFTSTTVPKMLVDIQTHGRAISYAGCLTQISIFVTFGCMDLFLLSVMAYDRFVAICHPLNYPLIRNPRQCVSLVLPSFVNSIFGGQMHSSVLRIPSTGGKYKAFSTCGSHLTSITDPEKDPERLCKLAQKEIPPPNQPTFYLTRSNLLQEILRV
ncbi:olfactory receptor 7E24-like [Thomomys bottae]